MLPRYLSRRNLTILLFFTAVLSFTIFWDLRSLNKEFDQLYLLLRAARMDALYMRTKVIVRFNGNEVTVTNQKDPKSMTTIIPRLAKVNYDTVMENNMIVYDLHGTSAYNKRIHGGEIMLKSWLGVQRYLHVNCNGVVSEGRYPE